MLNRKTSLGMLIGSMVIFGTIGIFRRFIPVSSPMLAFVRGAMGAGFLLLIHLCQRTIRKHKEPAFSLEQISSDSQLSLWKKFIWFGIPGGMIGLNWVLLFEAYRYTSISVATLCYYMAPTLVILCSPLVIGEKLTIKKLVCALTAVFGMVLISGIAGGELVSFQGILLGLGAAALYAAVILINKKAPDADVYEKTMIQLGAAAIFLLPYLLLGNAFSLKGLDPAGGFLLIVVGIVHTGVAYALYFGSIRSLKAQTVAILSYMDPVVALLLSWFILKEPFSVHSLLGAVLILGSTLISELSFT